MHDEYDDKDPSDRRPMLWVFVIVLVIATLAALGILWKGQALAPAMAWTRAVFGAAPSGSPTGQTIAADAGQRLGAWIAHCDSKAAPCALVQSVQAGGAAAGLGASWRIEAAPDGKLHVAWSLPTGVMVRPGMTLGFDARPPTTVPYESCAQDLCEVRAQLTANFVQSMRAAKASVATVILKQGGATTFTFSHDGLAEGLDLLASNAPARQGD